MDSKTSVLDVRAALDVAAPLSPAMAAIMRLGLDADTDGRYEGDRSRAFQGLAVAAVDAGWTEAQFTAAVCDPQNLGGDCLRTKKTGQRRSPRYAVPECARVWVKACRYVKLHPAKLIARVEILAALDVLDDLARSWPWPGRSGTTDAAVLADHLAIARRVQKLEHGRSVREAAEACGIGRFTVSRARARLRRAGWLEVVTRRRRGHPQVNVYRLQAPAVSPDAVRVVTTICAQKRHSSRAGEKPPNVPIQHNPPGHDAWRPRALGQAARRAYTTLLERGSMTARALAAALSRSEVRHTLAKLLKHELVTCDPATREWSAVEQSPAFFDKIAVDMGTAGRGKEQRDRHNYEREAHAPFATRIRQAEAAELYGFYGEPPAGWPGLFKRYVAERNLNTREIHDDGPSRAPVVDG